MLPRVDLSPWRWSIFSRTARRAWGEYHCRVRCPYLAPENVSLGENVYVGHDAMLKGYHRVPSRLATIPGLGKGLHSRRGRVRIGRKVGIGPFVRIVNRGLPGRELAIIEGELTLQRL